MKQKLLFVISQFNKGGAEVSLVNLFKRLDPNQYEIDFMVLNQCPLQGTVSLISAVPDTIHVIDIYKQEHNLSFMKKIKNRLLLSASDLAQYPASALFYARQHSYDWAFHIGEWWLPGFVATKVHATHKVAWIHTDLSEAEYFDGEAFFQTDSVFEHYIFASQNSLEASLKKYAFLKEKSICIYNINDVDSIWNRAKEQLQEPFPTERKLTVLTCANIRKAKNHLRQLKVMKILKERGIDFTWVNIGFMADSVYFNELRTRIKEYGLEDSFLLLGPKNNPYQYMARADVIAVLSDYESWSMVITEAKILGLPIIATKTSGALEQIKDRETGILTDFDEMDIANKLEELLTSSNLRGSIHDNIKDFDNTDQILRDFNALLSSSLLDNNKNKVLYIIDDINYQGGAHIATKELIHALTQKDIDITIFSSTLPLVKERNRLIGTNFSSWMQCKEDCLFRRRLLDCLTDPFLSKEDKLYKIKMTWNAKVLKDTKIYERFVKKKLSYLFSQYDTICVMSEGSDFRWEVAHSTAKRKVQYIHTDYCAWSDLSDWTKMITAHDEELYSNYDQIVLLSENIKQKFCGRYPSLSQKTVVNPNYIPVEQIRKKAYEKKTPRGSFVKFVTVGRMDFYKGFDRIFRAMEKLFEEGYQFHWVLIGGGENLPAIKCQLAESSLVDCVQIIGQTSNPFPYVKDADVFALFSRYEGLPNTIYEAFILGVPVISTNVGGISNQIELKKNGWLVDDDEEAIYKGLVHVLEHSEEIERYKENLKTYKYDNDTVIRKTEQILCSI